MVVIHDCDRCHMSQWHVQWHVQMTCTNDMRMPIDLELSTWNFDIYLYNQRLTLRDAMVPVAPGLKPLRLPRAQLQVIFQKEPLIIGLLSGKLPMKIWHPMTLRHPVSTYNIYVCKSWWHIYLQRSMCKTQTSRTHLTQTSRTHK